MVGRPQELFAAPRLDTLLCFCGSGDITQDVRCDVRVSFIFKEPSRQKQDLIC